MLSGGVAGRERASTQVEGSPSVVIFDFDGTLVSRDSFFDFSIRYCVRRPARVLAMLALSPLVLIVALHSTDAALSLLLWAMTLGISTRHFVAQLRCYAREELPRTANEAIFAELAEHARAGRRVAIATGSVPLLVQELLRCRGLPRLPIAGSRLRRKWGGLIAQTHCTGQTKVRELERRFGITRWAAVYTNSFADHPLMQDGADVTLVGPSRRTLLLTQRLIGPKTALRVLTVR